MNAYYTIEEKYLKAVRKVEYGRLSKGMVLLKEIIENEPLYARAHYQLGKIYYDEVKDYQSAGFHFKTCMEIEPSFPDLYGDYLDLLVFLNMKKLAHQVADKALTVPGVCKADIYDSLGLLHETNRQWNEALAAYRQALVEVTWKSMKTDIEESIGRVQDKIQNKAAYQYNLSE